jgi:CRP/FNR family transcriptional regulator, cyclic AMP receptor protein
VGTQSDPFAPLHPDTLRAIAESGVVRTFPRNSVLINEGDRGDALYVILSGRVKVYSSNEAGREFVIDFHGPGEYVGEMMLDGEPRSSTARSSASSSSRIRISRCT